MRAQTALTRNGLAWAKHQQSLSPQMEKFQPRASNSQIITFPRAHLGTYSYLRFNVSHQN